MESGCDKALINYFKTFNLSTPANYFEDLYTGETLVELWEVVCKENSNPVQYWVNSMMPDSQIEGFETILKNLYQYYKENHDLGVSKKKLNVNPYDIVNFKNEDQIYIIMKLIIGVIIKEQKEEWINNMMNLGDEEVDLMQTVCQEVIDLTDSLPKASEMDESNDFDSFNGSPSMKQDNGMRDQESIDKIIELNMHISTLQNEKQRYKSELSDEKKENSNLLTKIEKLQLDTDEMKGEIESLEAYKQKWEDSLEIIQSSETQKEYIRQLEEEGIELKEKLEKFKRDLEDLEEQKEEDITALREEIDTLNDKNIELVKNESLVVMYKKKLDSLKDLKQEKRAIEFERDGLRAEVEKVKATKGSDQDQRRTIDFYKKEIQGYKTKIDDYEEALKGKDKEIVKVKNECSKLERESKLHQTKIKTLQDQLEDHWDKSDEGVEEYKVKISQLEKHMEILKSATEKDASKEHLLTLEESNHEKDLEIQKFRSQAQSLQKCSQELESENDNLRNELSTLNDNADLGSSEVHRASVEGIKRNQIERDLRKWTQEKISLEQEVTQLKEGMAGLEPMKEERDLLRGQVQELYDQKAELQERFYNLKDEWLNVQSRWSELESEVKALKRENKASGRELDYSKQQQELLSKQVSDLMSSTSSTPSESQNQAPTDTQLLQKESEVLKLKLEIKESGEEYAKLEAEITQIREKNDKLINELTEKIKEEQDNSKKMMKMMQKQMQASRMQFQEESRLLASWLYDMRYEIAKRVRKNSS